MRYEGDSLIVYIVRPGNGRWACQSEHYLDCSTVNWVKQHRYALTL